MLTRRAVDKATLLDVSHQADLIATSQNVDSTILPLSKLNLLAPYFKKQHLTPLRHFDALPQSAKDKLAHNKPADGSVTINGVPLYFAARIVSGQPFVLLRPKSATRARWTPYVYSLLLAALVGGVLAALAAFLLARRIARPCAASPRRAAASRAASIPSRCPSRAPPSSRRSRRRSTISRRSSRRRARRSARSCFPSATS